MERVVKDLFDVAGLVTTAGAALRAKLPPARRDAAVVRRLTDAGHAVELLPAYSSVMGHAGALVREVDGTLCGACDPRSDGAVAGW
ncbi:hypothetical protein F0H33_15265 [Xanthomonas translucens pv. undulosa]|nr:hypothetical protein F0H33_15265 [Xanthomonas translucens pv. undulosa]